MSYYPQFVNNLCVEKELKVRVKELYKYRGAGLTNIADLIPFEKQRFKEEQRLKRLAKVKPGSVAAPSAKFLPAHGDYREAIQWHEDNFCEFSGALLMLLAEFLGDFWGILYTYF